MSQSETNKRRTRMDVNHSNINQKKLAEYRRFQLDYSYEVGKIYNRNEISKARISPIFNREYNLAYGYGIDNVVLPSDIESYSTRQGNGVKMISHVKDVFSKGQIVIQAFLLYFHIGIEDNQDF